METKTETKEQLRETAINSDVVFDAETKALIKDINEIIAFRVSSRNAESDKGDIPNNPPVRVIGFHGLPGSGKDSAARAIRHEWVNADRHISTVKQRLYVGVQFAIDIYDWTLALDPLMEASNGKTFVISYFMELARTYLTKKRIDRDTFPVEAPDSYPDYSNGSIFPGELNATYLAQDVKSLAFEFVKSVSGDVRKYTRFFGTEIGREIDPHVWVKKRAKQVLSALINKKKVPGVLSSNIGFVFTDIRFDNEAEFVKQIGGEIYHITRDVNKAASKRPGDVAYTEKHVSDAGIRTNYIDCHICNTAPDVREWQRVIMSEFSDRNYQLRLSREFARAFENNPAATQTGI